MDTDSQNVPFRSILSNRWLHAVLWIAGGCLWMSSLDSLQPQADSRDPVAIRLQRTQVDSESRVAWIDGQRLQEGQLLRTTQGVYRVGQIAPGTVVLLRGDRHVKLKLPKPQTLEANGLN